MARRAIASAAFGILATMFAAPAYATPTSRLAFVRGPGAERCPAEVELRSAVARRVGYDPFFPHADRIVVAQIDRADSARAEAGFQAQVRIVDGEGHLLGERRIGPMTDCGELTQSLALAISVAIDDIDVAPARPSEPAPAEPPIEAPAPRANAQAPDAASPSTIERPLRLRASLGVLGALGASPALNAGSVVGVGVRAKWWSASLEGRADLPASRAIDGGGRVETSLIVASVVPCVRLHAAVSPYACAVGSLGALRAGADDVTTPTRTSASYASIGGRAGLEIAIAASVAAYAQIDAAGTLTRHRLTLSDATVYELSGAQVALGAGFSMTFF